MGLDSLLVFDKMPFHLCNRGEGFVLSSSRMIKESRGNVAEAVAMGQRVVETLGTTSMIDTSLVTDAGVLEIVPSLQWFHEIT